jgi:hypothetical protein
MPALRQPREQRPRPVDRPPDDRRAGAHRRTGALVALLVFGVGLILAPAVFDMFSRAPAGGRMINEFRPFMTKAEVTELRGFLSEISAARTEALATVDPHATARLGLNPAEYRAQLTYLHDFEARWPGINSTMTDMLDRMHANLGNYAAVDALPPFPLFPWFFVVPGLLVAGSAAGALLARRRGASIRTPLVVLVVLGVGLVAAPFAFQMFSRAPQGGQMIDSFRPLMTRHKVTTIQGYFITIGNGEVQLADQALPAAALPPGSVPAAQRFVNDWPRINRDMAPVVGVMSDNIDNFAAVDALPPFPLFPWFFVIPGVAIALLAGFTLRRERRDPEPSSAPAPIGNGGAADHAADHRVTTTDQGGPSGSQ